MNRLGHTHGARIRMAPPTLTPRESSVLSFMAAGLSNAGIGARMCMSEKTVETHIGAVFAKLGLENDRHENRRVHAVLIWLGLRAAPTPLPLPSNRQEGAPEDMVTT